MNKQYQRVLVTTHILYYDLSVWAGHLYLYLIFAGAHPLRHPAGPLWFPTAIMMVAFYRHAGKMWPGIATACSFGNILASWMLFSRGSVSLIYPAVNVIEAVIGALFLRKWLPWYNPLQNLNDWIRVAIGSALVPPLMGGILVSLLAPGSEPLRNFFVWVLSEAIGALALVPLGLLFKPHYLLRHRDPRLLLETLTTLAVTLALSWAAITAAVALHLRDRSADVERRAPAANGSVHGVSGHRDGGVADDCPQSSGADHPARRANAERPWLPFLMLLLPANVMTMVMYAFRAERKHITESEERFRNAMEYSAIGMALVSIEGKWLQANKALCNFLGYSQTELQSLTFQQLTRQKI